MTKPQATLAGLSFGCAALLGVLAGFAMFLAGDNEEYRYHWTPHIQSGLVVGAFFCPFAFWLFILTRRILKWSFVAIFDFLFFLGVSFVYYYLMMGMVGV